jgi:hypothetical protein
MLEINQEWYIFEEFYYPYFARKINHIVDFDTNENFLEFPIGETPYFGFKVIPLNSDYKELAFNETYQINKLTKLRNELKLLKDSLKTYPIDDVSPLIRKKIKEIEESKNYVLNINLTPLELFQNSLKYFSRKNKHVKLDIEIIHTKPVIEDLSEIEKSEYLSRYKGSFHKSDKKIISEKKYCNINKLFPRLTSLIIIEGKSAPEITLILPPGWTVEESGKGISLELYDGNDANKDINLIEKFNLECFTRYLSNKLSFNYLIESKSDCESFSKFSNLIKDAINPKIYFTYNSTLTSHIKWVSLIPFFFGISVIGLYTALIIDVFNWIEFDFNYTYMLSSILILLTFSFYYNSLIKDGYIIPFMDWFFKTFFIYLISLILIFMIGTIL